MKSLTSAAATRLHPQVAHILANLETSHSAYYKSGVFSGPSLHFHLRALQNRECCDAFSESSYAMLASWGMHRMGGGGPKMKPFEVYKDSIGRVWHLIREAARFEATSHTEEVWPLLKDVFLGIDVMQTGTSLVGNSKVMAHALPHLIPPIDRNYTLRFLHANTTIRNDKQREWDTLKTLVTAFFLPVTNSKAFQQKCAEWKTANYRWDTSPLKIVDNLLIGVAKQKSGFK